MLIELDHSQIPGLPRGVLTQVGAYSDLLRWTDSAF